MPCLVLLPSASPLYTAPWHWAVGFGLQFAPLSELSIWIDELVPWPSNQAAMVPSSLAKMKRAGQNGSLSTKKLLPVLETRPAGAECFLSVSGRRGSGGSGILTAGPSARPPPS